MKKTFVITHSTKAQFDGLICYLNVAPDHGDMIISVWSLHLMTKPQRVHQLVNDNGHPDAVATKLTGRLLKTKFKSASINSKQDIISE